MKIGEVAKKSGVTVDTVRFYERRGLLPPPERQPSGYRIYGAGIVERIRLAKELQALGFTLDEVIDALHTFDAGDPDCSKERWRLENVLQRIDDKLAELRRTRREILRVLEDCNAGKCRFQEHQRVNQGLR
jgi:DNA-binding transcriptional MerR regulator